MYKVKLFCLPYGGKTAMVYSKWKKYLNPLIELYPMELAGRGRRISESYYNSIDEAVEDVYNSIKHELFDGKFVFFGHSMGALLIYELVCKIQQLNCVEPMSIFISGQNPPHIKDSKRKIHLLDDIEFTNEIVKRGGVSKEVLGQREILELFLPILRADFKMTEKYQYKKNIDKLNCNIIVFNGSEDLKEIDMLKWSGYTNKNFKYNVLKGNHFFIENDENMKKIIEAINLEIED